MLTKNSTNRLQVYAAILGIVSCSMLIPAKSFSATDGTLGSDSTGSVDISITKPAQARISSMTDMTLGSWVIGDGDVALNTTACIYSTSPDYTVTATGSGTSNAFTITDGVDGTALHTRPYTVAWNQSVGAGGTALTTNTPANFTGASVTSITCGGTDNAQINIAFTEANLVQLASGTFTGTLTVLVAPN
jgi:hypothetical protein